MYSLDHYDLFPDFSLREAAYLAAGIDPAAIANHAAAEAILEQMTRSVREMFEYLDRFNDGEVPDKKEFHSNHLVPIVLDTSHLNNPQGVGINIVIADSAFNRFRKNSSELRFDRAEIARWIEANGRGFKAKYGFVHQAGQEPVVNSSVSVQAGPWPWGTYETDLLRHLAAAAGRFWNQHYDPTDVSTAPTNEAVSEWLIRRGVSKNLAEAIATILRKDGLRTGPR